MAGQADGLSAPVLEDVFAAVDVGVASRVLDRRLGQGSAALASIVIGGAMTLDALRQPETLQRLARLAAEARRLGAQASEMEALLARDLSRVGEAGQQLLAARLDAEPLAEVREEIRRDVLTRRRDALTGWLVAYDPEMVDVGRIYERLLIDPETAPCLKNTRILAAITATQLFVQRFLFGLEQDCIAPNGEDDLRIFRARWDWMKSYRLWEANRKIFLFPENWLFPELRDAKSVPFHALEGALGKGELTKDVAAEAFSAFLDDVAQAGQVRPIGMFEDVERIGSVPNSVLRRDLYMVGRTANPPHKYFWRVCRDFGLPLMEWTPWQRIDIDISGDHVLPFVADGNFGLAWPSIQQGDSASGLSKWRVTLNWSSWNGTRWTDVRTSRTEDKAQNSLVEIDRVTLADERRGFTFRAAVNAAQSKVEIRVFAQDAIAGVVSQQPENRDELSQGGANLRPAWFSAAGVGDLKQFLKTGFANLSPEAKDYFCAAFNHYIARPTLLSNAALTIAALAAGLGALIVAPLVVMFPRPQFVGSRSLASLDFLFLSLKNIDQSIALFKNLSSTNIYVSGYGTELTTATNTALQSELIDQVFADLVGTGFVNTADYPIFVRRLLAGVTERRIRIACWAKVSLGQGYGYEPVGAEEFELFVSGSSRGRVRPGDEVQIELTLGAIPGTSIQLRWPAKANADSAVINLPAQIAGEARTHSLNFVFDGTISNRNNFGLISDADRSYSERIVYRLDGHRLIEINAVSGMPTLQNTVANSIVYLNGFLETENPASQSALVDAPFMPRISSQQTIFARSQTRQRFWAVGATQANLVDGEQSIWSFQEGQTRCLVDMARGQTPRLYAEAWNDEIGAGPTWRRSERLPGPSEQMDSFSASQLPVSTFLSATQRSGSQAFDLSLPYANYNWEVFLHAPLLIADQLSKNQRYEEADRWLRMVFDPTTAEPGATAARFMRFRPFRDLIGDNSMRANLELLARVAAREAPAGSNVSGIQALIARWRDEPYRPFSIARRRQVAFLWRTLFAYIDNLLAWADVLFRRDTREAIGEAALLYALVARILGRRPRVSDTAPSGPPKSYDELAGLWDDFGNAFLAVTPPKQRYVSSMRWGSDQKFVAAPNPGALHFCIPFNPKLFGYWDIIEDRLFKIRNCRNIEGVVRELPFVDPPIDPELLVRATAAGLDVGSVVAGLYAPPPSQRFAVMMSRANELTADTRGLGAALLTALEKRDAEALGLLRASHEVELLKRVQSIRVQQIEEVRGNLDALRATRKTAEARYAHLARLMGQPEASAPAEGEALPALPMLGRPGAGLGSSGSNLGLIAEEGEQYVGFQAAADWGTATNITQVLSGAMHTAGAIPEPVGVTHRVFLSIGHGLGAIGAAFSAASQGWRNYAERNGLLAGHLRRRDDWAFQTNQTLKELEQIDKQILANEIRLAIAVAERANHERQVEQTEEIADHLQSKFTNADLYDWMVGELSALHIQAYRMALDLARQAERAAVRELGLAVRDLSVISARHFEAGRAGLLAGERLHQELKQLEFAYHERNRRQHEMTKHVSLRLLDGAALTALKLEGTCEFEVPEWLFDMDVPGHFGRRLKAVSLSVPCVVGPYVGVNCKLLLQRSDIRHSPNVQHGYARTGIDDPRFTTAYGSIESIVTSTGRDDSGLFEVNLRDDRFLPFEHAGAISRWRLELTGKPDQFDHATISDVILHLRYTARSDDALANPAATSLQPGQAVKAQILISLKEEFSPDWMAAKAGSGVFTAMIDTRFLPYGLRRSGQSITKIETLRLTRGADGGLAAQGDWTAATLAGGVLTVSGVKTIEDCLVALTVGT